MAITRMMLGVCIITIILQCGALLHHHHPLLGVVEARIFEPAVTIQRPSSLHHHHHVRLLGRRPRRQLQGFFGGGNNDNNNEEPQDDEDQDINDDDKALMMGWDDSDDTIMSSTTTAPAAAAAAVVSNHNNETDDAIIQHDDDVQHDVETEYGFQIKLYWEEGYTWQNETRERKWCMIRDFDEGNPNTGQCWYGNASSPCNETMVYIDRCSSPDDPDPRQLFEFIPVAEATSNNNDTTNDNGEVLIAAYGEDRCFERYRTNITLQPCNAKIARQRWFAIRGGFFSNHGDDEDGGGPRRFEISQKLVPTNCVSQDHHPKAGENVRMYLCDTVRLPSQQTSWWNIY